MRWFISPTRLAPCQRVALYLHFKNRGEIFNAMVAEALEKSGGSKAKGLSGSGSTLATILIDGMEGPKQRAKTAEERSDGAKALEKLIAG
jgi:AcrR family transcriptional regulator